MFLAFSALELHQAVDTPALKQGINGKACDNDHGGDPENPVRDSPAPLRLDLTLQCSNPVLDVLDAHLRAPQPIRYFKARTVFDFSRRRR